MTAEVTTGSSLFALSKPNNPRPVPSLMALSSDRSSLLFLSRSVAVQVQEHQKRFCRRPLDGKNTERHVGRPSPPLQQPEALGLPTPPARAGGRPPSPPPLWVVGFVWGSGLPGGLGCLRGGVGVWVERGRRGRSPREGDQGPPPRPLEIPSPPSFSDVAFVRFLAPVFPLRGGHAFPFCFRDRAV